MGHPVYVYTRVVRTVGTNVFQAVHNGHDPNDLQIERDETDRRPRRTSPGDSHFRHSERKTRLLKNSFFENSFHL